MAELFNQKLRVEGVKGVGTMELDFQLNQRVYTLIGENGVGKTKFLESLFTYFLLINKYAQKNYPCWINVNNFPFKSILSKNGSLELDNLEKQLIGEDYKIQYPEEILKFEIPTQEMALVYIAAQNRGGIEHTNNEIEPIGSSKNRLNSYLKDIFEPLVYGNQLFRTLNTNLSIEEWIIQRAQSANPYQTKEDNREIEIKTLLSLLNKIDQRIDAEFLEISGSNRVFIKIEDQKRELSELSSGFSSILKILQSIIAGYSYFTNETHIANVRGVVLIDEIESHLHNQWQVKIIPLLKQLFPNTIFYITTHSSLVISQLNNGEAYRLQREKDGVVYAKPIKNPSRVTFVDLLQEAFDINLNQLKVQRAMQDDQSDAKKALLTLLDSELEKMEEK